MINETSANNLYVDENGNPVQPQYVDEFGNPIDPSLIDEFGNYIGAQTPQYVDENGNPIDPSLIDASGNYIGEQQSTSINENTLAQTLNTVTGNDSEVVESVASAPISAAAHQMDGKDMFAGMVTFDYNNVPITDIVNSIILDAINKGASDIHFDPFDEGIKIRIRIDGQLNDYSIVPLYVKRNMITRIKIVSGMNITESRVPQDGAIRTELANKTVDLRVSCLPTNVGEKIVIRIMDYSMSAAGIEALDFSEENLEKVKKMINLPNGIILVTGATGSGKSTTVYAMLQRLNVEGTNLVTVEDPIEMNIGGINQVQAASEIGLTFASVLRSILRQDPDVIMIGEIRDDETARIAVRASITGHLVLSTIHTNNSLNTIERLTDMSVERYLLGSSLSGVISQKLSRRLCDKCKRLRPTSDYEKDILRKVFNKDVEEIYEPVGCPECSRGYRGRIAIHEVLLLNQTIKDAITKGVPKETLRKLVYSNHGTSTMLEDGLSKVLEGKTSFEEILKLIDLEDDLGSGSQLGLEDQISDSELNNGANQVSNTTAPTTANLSGPININFPPELLEALKQNTNNARYADDDDDEEPEVIVRRKKKKKKPVKVIEIDEDEIEDIEEEETVEEKIKDSTPTPSENKSDDSKFEEIFSDIEKEEEKPDDGQDEIDRVLKDIDAITEEMLEEKIPLDDPLTQKLLNSFTIKEINDFTNDVFDFTDIMEETPAPQEPTSEMITTPIMSVPSENITPTIPTIENVVQSPVIQTPQEMPNIAPLEAQNISQESVTPTPQEMPQNISESQEVNDIIAALGDPSAMVELDDNDVTLDNNQIDNLITEIED